uniref:Reverse transcriptase domain-containing protein n=1 Tax=Tanacetum cinerariifolium TaxID=118510 RepID=A0A699HXN3_TANCI|nr:hypothetical protein [Tanacetum cinerariifolium]
MAADELLHQEVEGRVDKLVEEVEKLAIKVADEVAEVITSAIKGSTEDETTMQPMIASMRIGSEHEDENEHIEKVLEIVDLFHIPKVIEDQIILRAFPVSLTRVKMEEINNFQQEPDESLFRAWERSKELLMKCAIPSKSVIDAKIAIQEMAEYSQKRHNGTSSKTRSTKTFDGLAVIQA